MKTKELLSSITGEEVTVVIESKVTFTGMLSCNKYGSEYPVVHTGFIDLHFSFDCVTQIIIVKNTTVIELNLTPAKPE